MVERTVNIRLSLKDGEVVRRGLMSLGEEGQRALRRIEAVGAPVSKSLLLVDASVKELRGSVSNLAASAGPIGNVLGVLGPKGLFAAAGIGAATLGMKALWDQTTRAVEKLDDLQDAADRLGIGTESLQALRFAGQQLGVDVEQVDGAIQKLNQNLGDIARGGGKEALEAFHALGVNVRDAQGRVLTVEEILPRLADGFNRVRDATMRTSLAVDVFGRGNSGFVTALQGGSEALEEAIQKAREMGAVIDEELVRRGADAKDELAALALVIDAQLTAALVDLAPAVVAIAGAFAVAVKWVSEFIDKINSIDPRLWFLLGNPIGVFAAAQMSRPRRQPLDLGVIGPSSIDDSADPISNVEGKENFDRDLFNEMASKRAAAARRAQAQAAREAASAERALNEVMEEGRRVYDETRTASEKYEIAIERLEMLLARGAISQDTFTRALADAQEELARGRLSELGDRKDPLGGLERALAKMSEEAKDHASVIENAFTSTIDGIEAAWVNFAKTGKFSLDDLEQHARTTAAKMAFHFAQTALFGFLPGGGGLSGLFGGGAAGGTGGPVSGGAPAAAAAAGGMAAPRLTVNNFRAADTSATTSARQRSDGGYDLEVAINAAVDKRNTETMPARMATGFGITSPVRQRRMGG